VSRRTVFLDRDGTLNVKAPEGDYIRSPDQVVLLPGVADGVRRLNEAGMRLVVVSNQRGVARGLMTLDDLAAVQRRLADLLAEHGARIDRSYYCPHGVGECDCRKPLPGLLLQAARDDPDVDLGNAVVIGDAESDVGAAAAVGVPAIRIVSAPVPTAAAHTAPDFGAAVDLVLGGATAGQDTSNSQ
jgi:D-glycero-D-manno-heptose 1,7-bisphosphate phosphatase